MNICTILLAFFCALGGYIIGFRRASKTYKADNKDYYNAGYESGLRAARGEQFLASLEDALGPEDDDVVIDCGEY